MLIHTLKSLLAAVGTGLLLTAAAARAADPGIGDSTITLGMSAPFSGPNGAYGKEMREGALAYFAQLNAQAASTARRSSWSPSTTATKPTRRSPTPAS
jgi:ABC-type branched-subunit amino acid transport system substrate-binding protein